MTDNFLPSSDPAALSTLCAASLRANGELLGAMLRDMPPEKHEAIDRLLAGGGSDCIETRVDHRANNTISLIAIEREGARLVLATIAAS